jgi:hypothetical protein
MSGFQWGNLAEWVGGVGTVGSLWVGLGVLVSQRQEVVQQQARQLLGRPTQRTFDHLQLPVRQQGGFHLAVKNTSAEDIHDLMIVARMRLPLKGEAWGWVWDLYRDLQSAAMGLTDIEREAYDNQLSALQTLLRKGEQAHILGVRVETLKPEDEDEFTGAYISAPDYSRLVMVFQDSDGRQWWKWVATSKIRPSGQRWFIRWPKKVVALLREAVFESLWRFHQQGNGL